MGNFKKNIQKLFTNVYFLYFMFALTFFNILGYLAMNDYISIILFSLIALFSTFFEKNMSIILIISLLLTPLFKSLSQQNKENMDVMKNKKETIKNKEIIHPLESEEKNESTETDVLNNNDTNESEHHEVSGANEKLINNGSSGNRIDLAATLEESYDNLNSILGTEGINKLTSDTSKLMKEQKKLFESMQMMSPLLKEAKQMLEGFDMKQINNMVNTASSFLSKK